MKIEAPYQRHNLRRQMPRACSEKSFLTQKVYPERKNFSTRDRIFTKGIFFILGIFVLVSLVGGVNALDISTCQTLDIDNEYYVLTQDITIANTPGCFSITGQNITLDFNGNSLYFTESSASVGTLLDIGDDFDQYRTQYNADGSIVTNGSIIQVPSAVYSPGSANLININCDNCSLQKMYIYSFSPRRQSIVIGGRNTADHSVEVFNNTIINNDTTINLGHGQEGMISISFLELDGATSSRGLANIHNNVIKGRSYLVDVAHSGPIGIMATVKINNNFMYPYKISRNPYAIRFYHQYSEVGSEIINNTIISNNSRGILIGTSSGLKIQNNYLDVAEQNIVGVDDFGVSFGFRMRYLSQNNNISGNTFKIRALAGEGISPSACMISPRTTPLVNSFNNNTCIGITETSLETSTALAIDGNDGSTSGDYSLYTIENNTIVGNSLLLNYGAGNGPAHNSKLVSTIFRRENPLGSFRTISIGEWEITSVGTIGHHLIDPTFENWASDLDIDLTENGRVKELFLDWYLNIIVKENNVEVTNPVNIIIVDNQSNLIYSETLANGVIPRQVLNEYRMYTTTLSPNYTNYTSHNITVTYDGETQSRLVNMNESKTEIFEFSSCALIYDSGCDGIIDNTELGNAVSGWFGGNINVADLFRHMRTWKS